MSNIDRERNPDSLAEVLRFTISQWVKLNVHTALPGIVSYYDNEIRRADVTAAIRTVMTDGTEKERAPLFNVPVLFPSGGGYTMTFPVSPGDGVLLVFNERSISTWKQTYQLSTPALRHILSYDDAVAVAGFGPLNVTPASSGASMQSVDGSEYITLNNGGVEIKHSGNVNIDAGSITFRSSTLTHNGADISASHNH